MAAVGNVGNLMNECQSERDVESGSAADWIVSFLMLVLPSLVFE